MDNRLIEHLPPNAISYCRELLAVEDIDVKNLKRMLPHFPTHLLHTLLDFMEKHEEYERCAIIRDVLREKETDKEISDFVNKRK